MTCIVSEVPHQLCFLPHSEYSQPHSGKVEHISIEKEIKNNITVVNRHQLGTPK